MMSRNTKPLKLKCFNPCFSGSCSRIAEYVGLTFRKVDVSILVLVDLAREYDSSFSYTLYCMFQSLFQWILLANSFIHNVISLWYQFQSLFQWILLANQQQSSKRLTLMSFNPCFSGSCSRIKQKTDNLRTYFQFQSLFQWILLANVLKTRRFRFSGWSFNPCFSGSCSRISREGAHPPELVMFQSLFQWILLANSCIRIDDEIMVGFNPCFSGSCSRILRHVP